MKKTKAPSHRTLYPEQYSHPLVGKRVEFTYDGERWSGIVLRVMPTRFGPLAAIDSLGPGKAVAIDALEVL